MHDVPTFKPSVLLTDGQSRPRPAWRMPALVALVCSLAFLATAGWSSASGDVTATNVLSWQLANTGDPLFDADTFPPLDQHPGRDIWVIERADEGEAIGRSPGAVLAAIPAYWAFGRGGFSVGPGALTAALLSALAAWLMALALQELMPRRAAALAALVFALATPVWTVAANGMWPHTITVLGICGMAWAAARERWWLVGLFGGVVLWGRLHAAVIVAILGLLLGWQRRDARLTTAVGVTSALLLALQGLWTRWVYGSWNPLASYETGKFEEYAGVHTFDLANQLGFWISPDRGFLVWSPIVVLLLPSLLRHWRELPDWSRALLLAGVSYTILQGVLNRFSGGDSFYGYRLTLELLACATPALALSALRMGHRASYLFAPVLAFQALTLLPGAVNNRLGSPADEVWTTHAFFSALYPQTWLIVPFLLICLAAGVLGRRIWDDVPSDPAHGRPGDF